MRAFGAACIVAAAVVGGASCDGSSRTRGLSAQDRILVLAPVNRTEDPVFDDTIGDALGLLVRQSPVLSLVADQQVQATLHLTRREPAAIVTAAIGREICARVGATVLLGTEVTSTGSGYGVLLTAHRCLTGEILTTQQAEAWSRDTVFDALGIAVSALRAGVGESADSIRRNGATIEESATASLDAFKAYSQGNAARRRTGDFDAVPFFTRAIEIDSGFALAYARLGSVYGTLNRVDEERQMATRAYEVRQRASEAERLFIEARYFTTVRGGPGEALDRYQRVLSTYPDDYLAIASAAQLLRQFGRHDEAVHLLAVLTRVASNSAFAWTSLGAALTETGRYDEAKRALQAALSIQDTAQARTGLFAIGVFTSDRALADAQVEAMRGRRDDVEFLRVRIDAATYQGRFQEASALAGEWEQRMEQSSHRARIAEGVLALAFSEALAGKTGEASDRVVDAAADDLLPSATLPEQQRVSVLSADARTSRELAIPAFEAAHTDEVAVWAAVQMRIERWADAERALVWLLGADSRKGFNSVPAFAMASLARAQAATGRTAEARQTYQRFFEFWKDADADVPLLVQAKREFEGLGE